MVAGQHALKIGDISVASIQRILRFAESRGLDRDTLIDYLGIEENWLHDPEERVGLIEYMRLGHWIIKHVNVPWMGLELGKNTTVTQLGYPGMAAMSAPDLGTALTLLTEFEPLTSRCYRGRSRLAIDSNDARLQFYSIAPYNSYNSFVVDAVLSTWNTLIHWLSGRSDLVTSVHIEFPAPDYAERYQELFQCPVYFQEPFNGLIMKREALELTIPYSDPLLHSSLVAQCNLLMSQLTRMERFTHRVQKILGPMLHGKTPTIEETAEQLNMPTWTLRRKLKEEGTSFQILLDSMRKDLALGYMKDTGLSFGEIAYILGFSTPGAFQRAFKRWTDTTPGEYRKSLLSE